MRLNALTMILASTAFGLGLAVVSVMLLMRQTDVVQPNAAVRFVIAPAYIGRSVGLELRSGGAFAFAAVTASFLTWWALSMFTLGAISRSKHRFVMYACVLVFVSIWVMGAYLGRR